MRCTKRNKVHVPWLELASHTSDYLDINTIPKGFKVLDPSKLTKLMIGQLWDHWSEQAKAKLPILEFNHAQPQDRGLHHSSASRRAHMPSWNRKRKVYVSAESDNQASNDELDGCAEPSKHPHHSEQTTVHEEESPAANNSDREKFLYNLSSDPSYRTLLAVVLTLPILVCPFIFFIGMNFSDLIYKPSPQSSSKTPEPNLLLPL